jgi:hypothetical protein
MSKTSTHQKIEALEGWLRQVKSSKSGNKSKIKTKREELD